MRRLWKEFKSFAFKGNMVDLAVAVVIGAAFTGAVNSLVKNLIMPVLSYIIPTQGGYLGWHIGRVQIGAFFGEVVNFLIVAAAVFFMIVKMPGTVLKRLQLPGASNEPATRECPMCLSTIPYRAKRCAHCTADLPEPAAPPAAESK
jgi:large conductance mechanosensitive channel